MSSETPSSAQGSALAEIEEVEAQLAEQPLAVAATSGIKRSGLATFLWAAPATVWLFVFLLAPVVMIVLVSLWTRDTNGFKAWSWTTENYRTFWNSQVFRTALLHTFQRAVFVCVLSLAIGYPIAYFLTQIKSLRKQIALFILVLAPFWTAYLIRVIAWSPVLGQNGAINYLAGKVGLGPWDFLLYSDFAVNLTLVQLYVLFMVTPVFFQLAAIDSSAVEAAKDLGASPFKVFREVILPLSLPGVMIGFIFIFVLVMGDFATVRVIGGSTVDSVGNEVNVYYNNVDLPTAAAGASMLVVAMMIGVVILLRFAKIRDSISVVASAKQRHAVLDAIGKRLIYAVVAVLALYTLYASWLTLLELAVGIAAVGHHRRALRAPRPQAAARARRVLRRLPLAHVRPDDPDDAALVPGLPRAHAVPGVGDLLDLLVPHPRQRLDPAGAARLDRRLAQAERARLHHHRRCSR